MVIYPRKIVSEALLRNAHAVVLAHNHPSGVAEPSEADIRTTDALSDALKAVDIQLQDHIIYADGVCTSLHQWREALRIATYTITPVRKAADTKRPRQPKEDGDG